MAKKERITGDAEDFDKIVAAVLKMMRAQFVYDPSSPDVRAVISDAIVQAGVELLQER